MAAAIASKATDDPELVSVKRVLKLLDKTAKSNRTYGSTNPVAQKFSQQLFEELSTHLSTYSRLTFLVQRSALMCKDQIVYQPEQDSTAESIAFKLYADGIRELSILQGVTQEELGYFLDSLWSTADAGKDDDDIVTRLWARNLSTLTVVTAEEVAKSSGGHDGFLLLDASLSSSDMTLRELLDREQSRGKGRSGASGGEGAAEQGGGSGTGGGSASRRFKSNLIGYEVTEQELDALSKEVSAENQRDDTLYVLDMATAILASEKSPQLLTKLFRLWGSVVDSLLKDGRWTVLENVLGQLHETETVRPDLSEDHKRQLAAVFDGLSHSDRLKTIESYLNRTPGANTEGLSTIFFLMKPDAVPGLCSVLANLEAPGHQAIVAEALFTLAKDHPEPILRGLADRRPAYVRNLLAILTKWNNPRFVDSIEKLMRYPDMHVRKDVIKALGLLRPSGNGTKLITFVTDADESIRLAALKLLMSGQYTASFSNWSTLLSSEEFMERHLSERRAVYHAVRATSGDEAVPYWQQLFTEWNWTHRKKKEELAILAAEALGKLATPSAIESLEIGQKKGASSVRQACAMALSHIQKQQRAKTPLSANS